VFEMSLRLEKFHREVTRKRPLLSNEDEDMGTCFLIESGRRRGRITYRKNISLFLDMWPAKMEICTGYLHLS